MVICTVLYFSHIDGAVIVGSVVGGIVAVALVLGAVKLARDRRAKRYISTASAGCVSVIVYQEINGIRLINAHVTYR